MKLRLLSLLAGWLLVGLFGDSSAQAGAIGKLPFTITKPGQYFLLKNLTYTGTGNAITINTDDVTIDLRGFTISGDSTVAAANINAGVFATGRKNLTIRNGMIRGFFRGIFLEGTDDPGAHLVEGINVTDCAFLGIQVKGRFSIIRGNRVSNIKSTTNLSALRYGIHVTGPTCRIADNEVFEVIPFNSGSACVGIFVDNAISDSIENNRVQQSQKLSNSSTGISLNTASGAIVQRNQVTSYATGILFITSAAKAKLRDNIVTDAVSAYDGNFADGGNNQ